MKRARRKRASSKAPLDALTEPVRGAGTTRKAGAGTRLPRTSPRKTIRSRGEQDPHALQGARDNMLEVAIGREVRGFPQQARHHGVRPRARRRPVARHAVEDRERRHLGVADDAAASVEGARRAGDRRCSAASRSGATRCSSRAGQGLLIERRGTRAGHQYQLLGHTGGLSGSRRRRAVLSSR